MDQFRVKETNISTYKTTNELIKECTKKKICTFVCTSEEYHIQEFFFCKDCYMKEGYGVCKVCADICHKNHNLVSLGIRSCFCDCPISSITPLKCQCYPDENFSKMKIQKDDYITFTSNFKEKFDIDFQISIDENENHLLGLIYYFLVRLCYFVK